MRRQRSADDARPRPLPVAYLRQRRGNTSDANHAFNRRPALVGGKVKPTVERRHCVLAAKLPSTISRRGAAVRVLSEGGKLVAAGQTDDTGHYRVKVSTGGTFHIVVKSAFLKGGMKDTYADGSGNGSDATVTMFSPMSSVTIPAPS